ncbi:uncharacterized protein TA07030 [Theileria annulata]|uniref:RRM domain-containing protein n=1 Tax=Theileria annulata TaxID=5874 RepID=Q4UAM6_THEAN|nr:uncharacterized protein TA07030 [Theileria annulata]CAI76125.1 hypothetical protein, conserved [Theileria annulata]|eukprot:XP_952751.1 hypothetical protein, conserved [Theileria annulata]
MNRVCQSNKCRVYVGNLSWKVRWQDLKDHMKQVGEVIRADIIEDYEGKSKGCGIVEFADEESASRAIAELNDTLILVLMVVLDRQIFVREDRENYNTTRGYGRFLRLRPRMDSHSGYSARSSGRGGTSVIVTNLQWRTSWKELKDLFKNCGLVIRADVLTHEDGRSKGVGKVVFANEYSARKAITMYNDYVLDGRKIGIISSIYCLLVEKKWDQILLNCENSDNGNMEYVKHPLAELPNPKAISNCNTKLVDLPELDNNNVDEHAFKLYWAYTNTWLNKMFGPSLRNSHKFVQPTKNWYMNMERASQLFFLRLSKTLCST